jgi:hypothetical protein
VGKGIDQRPRPLSLNIPAPTQRTRTPTEQEPDLQAAPGIFKLLLRVHARFETDTGDHVHALVS